MSDKPLALIVGVGAATGRAVCERLGESHRVCMVARSRNVIDELAARLPQAWAFQCDVTDTARWQETLARIVAKLGVPDRIHFNTEGGGWGDYTEIDLPSFASSFAVNVQSLLVMVQTLFPDRSTIRSPCRIVISSSPAAYESNPRYLGLAPSRAAQRVLAETLHAMLSDHGVEFCILSIAGAIDEPKMRRAFPNAPDTFFIAPSAIAERVWRMFTEPLSTKQTITNGG
jgi:NAD(P)-dependent dehydrogenase (short-subunit alcohol dehydrogenase family)